MASVYSVGAASSSQSQLLLLLLLGMLMLHGCQAQTCASCTDQQYCLEDSSGALCLKCADACSGCTGPDANDCKACAVGYTRINPLAMCERCPVGTFGESCNGTCHCFDNSRCSVVNGFCESWKCAWGWFDPPYCQKQCQNETFGLDCSLQCHCLLPNECNPVNGLCTSGQCNPDYGGPGCQIRFPKLVNPPTLASVRCQQVNLTWAAWNVTVDQGEGPISKYVVLLLENGTESWRVYTEQSVVSVNQTLYWQTISLNRDLDYRFRVDAYRRDESGKVMGQTSPGAATPWVFVPCDFTTLTPTPFPLTTTTARVIVGVKVFRDLQFNINQGDMTVTWNILSNLTSYNFSISVTYAMEGIGNCASMEGTPTTVSVPHTNGSLALQGLMPWRRYRITVVAVSLDPTLNTTDTITEVKTTVGQRPNGTVSNFQLVTAKATEASVQWTDLPCDKRGGDFVRFEVLVNDSSGGSPRGLMTNTTSIVVTQLSPYTNYSLRVRYVAATGQGDFSDFFHFATAEDVPGFVRITSVVSGTRNISVTFNPPAVTNGVLTEYRIMHSTSSNFPLPLVQQSLPADATSGVIRGLEPYTEYFIRMQAATSAGWGAPSQEGPVRTKSAEPLAPSGLSGSYSNETCVGITWREPQTLNGVLQGYKVTYVRLSPPSTAPAREDIVASTVTSYGVCGLDSGASFLFNVSANTDAGLGLPASTTVWTQQATPRQPRAPRFINATLNTITIEIEPVILTGGPLSAYQISVNKVQPPDGRRKRAALTEIPGNVTAELGQGQVVERTVFVIGDGRQYGPYTNSPLTPNSFYDVYYVVISTLNNVSKASFAVMPGPVETRLTVPTTTTTPPPAATTAAAAGGGGVNAGLIAGIVVLIFILLLIIFLLLLFWWWRRRGQRLEAKELVDLTYEPAPRDFEPEKLWNTTTSLRESRYIVAGREYVPDDDLFQNGAMANGVTAGPKVTFAEEFRNLPKRPTASVSVAKLERNRARNRFPHLLPYDSTRVVLQRDSDCNCDYVNASYMSGFQKKQAYIAAQSPFDDVTVLDFWRLIYQRDIITVVMITNIEEDHIIKCTQYWPNFGSGSVTHGSFALELSSEEEYGNYTIRNVVLSRAGVNTTKAVTIFEFTGWPDHGVPDDPIPLLEMRRKVAAHHASEPSPILVHCGTGMGRTGTFIAVDALIRKYRQEGRISVHSFVKNMRRERPNMVRTLKEYVFIYAAVFEEFHAGDTVVGYELKQQYHRLTLKNPKTGHSYLRDQFRLLGKFHRPQTADQCKDALLPCNRDKNRFRDVIPRDDLRPQLMTPDSLGVHQGTDYINAVFLDSYRRKNQFILTQTPLHTTIRDFWKLVYDYNVNTIVMMENFKNEDDTCAEYWPTTQIKEIEPFFVESTATYQQDNITIRNFRVLNTQRPGEEGLCVRQFQFNAWAEPDFTPVSKTMVLDLLDLVDDWQQVTCEGDNPIVVHCKDGATNSGLFVALWNVCEKILDDEQVDVYHTVRQLKKRRVQIVSQMEQYKFCYKTLWDYMNLRMPGGTFTDTLGQFKADDIYGLDSLNLTSYQTSA